MPIVLELLEGHKTGLVAVCDVCGERVYDNGGTLCWDKASPARIGDRYQFKIACKGRCDEALKMPYWQDVGVSLVYLINNTKTDIQKSLRLASLLSQI